MNKNYSIIQMTEADMKVAMRWSKKEGWNPGLYDGVCFYRADPTGFFAGKIKDKIVSTVSLVKYDENYGFCGLYIVDPRYRGKSYGIKLIDYIRGLVDERNIGVDGVLSMVHKYEQLGFRTSHLNFRYECHALPKYQEKNLNVISLNEVSFEQLALYDLQHFPAQREAFLKCWISQPKSKAVAFVENQQIKGYGVIRSCNQGFKIAPLFADNFQIAEQLFLSLSDYAHQASIFIDIPEHNIQAMQFIEKYPFQKVFETARMYSKGEPTIKKENIYGITSLELG